MLTPGRTGRPTIWLAGALGLATLSACTEPTRLVNPRTAAVDTCWNPLYEVPLYAAAAPADSQGCVHAAEARGYVRAGDDGFGP